MSDWQPQGLPWLPVKSMCFGNRSHRCFNRWYRRSAPVKKPMKMDKVADMKMDKVADMTVEDKVKQTRWARCPGSGVQGQGPGVRAGGLEVGAQRAPRLLVTYNCPV